jgi:hypothetical protein
MLRRDAFAAVAGRMGYGDWRGTNRLGEELFVWNLMLAPTLMPGWYAHAVEVVHARGWPRAIQSVWRDERERVALVDAFECASRAEAHALLLRILALAESPLIGCDDDPALGDVAFRGPGDGFVLLARANVVALLRTADRRPLDIPRAAARLDAELVAKPPVEVAAAAPAIRELVAATPAVRRGDEVALGLTAEAPAAEPLWYKAFSPTGELSRRDDRLQYRQTSASPARLEVYAVTAGGAAARRELRLGAA